MKIRSVTIDPTLSHLPVSEILKRAFSVSETLLRQLKRRPGSVLLNGEPTYVVTRVQTGDTVSFDPSDPKKLPIRPISLALPIVYEDEWLTVLDKPANLSVHPSRDPNEPTVENALAARYPGTDNPHPVSRLDRGTSGLMAVAKSGYVHALMKAQQHDGRFRKTYLAITNGVPESEHFFIDAPIGPLPGSTYQRTVRSDGAPAKSECTVLETRGGLALVKLVPHTGRTHQLRVHMAYAGTPLMGDWLYGTRDETVSRPLLHAHTLAFDHPITGERIELVSPPPEEFLQRFPLEKILPAGQS